MTQDTAGRTMSQAPAPRPKPPPACDPGLVAIESWRFGAVQAHPDDIIRFVRPIVGFDHIGAYAVIRDPETEPVLWLQAVNEPTVLFAAVDAGLVAGEDYGVDLDDRAVADLGLERVQDARPLCILILAPDVAAITADLRAPIVWNTRRGLAVQVILNDPSLPARQPVHTGPRRNKEVARARSQPPQE